MAYPTNALSQTLQDLDRRAAEVKSYCNRIRAVLAVGNTPATTIIDLAVRLNSDKAFFTAAGSVPGLEDYARQQKNSPTLDVIAEFTSMVSAMNGCVNWIVENFPKDASGYLLRETWGQGGPVDRVFTPSTTAGLRTQLDSVIATIA